jgi:hypothetical protein
MGRSTSRGAGASAWGVSTGAEAVSGRELVKANRAAAGAADAAVADTGGAANASCDAETTVLAWGAATLPGQLSR